MCRRRIVRTDAQRLAEHLERLPSGRVVFDEHGNAWQKLLVGTVTYWYRAYADSEPVSSLRLAQETEHVTIADPRRT